MLALMLGGYLQSQRLTISAASSLRDTGEPYWRLPRRQASLRPKDQILEHSETVSLIAWSRMWLWSLISVILITPTPIHFGHIEEDLVLSESSLGNTHISDRLIQLVGIFLGIFVKKPPYKYGSLTIHDFLASLERP